jgi:hypothetical protein
MNAALEKLGVDVEASMPQTEAMCIFIHESMSTSSRNYHSVQHVFDISENLLEDPLAVLAALFHDCVYHHVDGGLSEKQSEKLRGAIVEASTDQGPALRTHPDSASDKLLSMVLSIFGFAPGQSLLPAGGQNEFLSAAIAVRELEPLLTVEQLACVAACVEATIPFRPDEDVDGEKRTAMDRLHDNLAKTVREMNLNMTDDEIVKVVQRAVLMSNEDVGNFGTIDLMWFLDNTWMLLPETNEALRHEYLYTVEEFQHAVFKMNAFFGFLNPALVFQEFRGVPDKAELAEKNANAARNVLLGAKYVAAKLISISFIAAVAELTGGDAPICLFMGDLPSRRGQSRRLVDALPYENSQTARRESLLRHHARRTKDSFDSDNECLGGDERSNPVCDEIIYELLAQGRRKETRFDVKQSPLAAYFYAHLGDEGVARVLSEVTVYPMNQEVAVQLLKALPRHAVLHVTEEMAPLALSRKEEILALADKYLGPK